MNDDYDDPWTCPCGHELDQDDTNYCIVRDRLSTPHRMHRASDVCECHGSSTDELLARRW